MCFIEKACVCGGWHEREQRGSKKLLFNTQSNSSEFMSPTQPSGVSNIFPYLDEVFEFGPPCICVCLYDIDHLQQESSHLVHVRRIAGVSLLARYVSVPTRAFPQCDNCNLSILSSPQLTSSAPNLISCNRRLRLFCSASNASSCCCEEELLR